MSIEVQNISKSYGAQKALDNVSFSVKKGEIVGFLGPNGAGKSTLMKILTTFLNADEGLATVNGNDVTENQKAVQLSIGYLPEQITWCQENESYIWRYFIEKELLYSTDSKLPNRFTNMAPFSKFYLEIDNESPGRVGQWIGWQIVRSFMQNNKVSMQEMIKMDAKELFKKSKYKPKKNDE
jgi:energy-coupling factor transporter ATP-binding protein EcfA2